MADRRLEFGAVPSFISGDVLDRRTHKDSKKVGIKHIKGNIFTTKVQTVVNTVNCVGVMGAGIALEFRLREPAMYQRYQQLCESGVLRPGTLWLFKAARWLVLNFPTKDDWKHPSRREYLEMGLKKFVSTYQEKGIKSIAFPMLGADRGGLPLEVSRELMHRYLEPLNDLDVEIYEYDPKAPDDLFEDLRAFILSMDPAGLARTIGLTRARLETVTCALRNNTVCQVNQLGALPGIGPVTLEKLFALRAGSTTQPVQGSLLDL